MTWMFHHAFISLPKICQVVTLMIMIIIANDLEMKWWLLAFFFIDHESSCHYVCLQQSMLLTCKNYGSLLCFCYFLQVLIIAMWFWKKKSSKDGGNYKIARCILVEIIILLLLTLFWQTGNSVGSSLISLLHILHFHSFLTPNINMCFNMKKFLMICYKYGLYKSEFFY